MRQPDYEWAGHPVFRCRYCDYELVAESETVDGHERAQHADDLAIDELAMSEGMTREAVIAALKGQPAQYGLPPTPKAAPAVIPPATLKFVPTIVPTPPGADTEDDGK